MTAAAAQAQTGLEEIVVTAQRRSENLQSVPIAITAFSSAELERRQITRTIDLVTSIPNLQGHNNTGLGSANTYYLRGLGNTESLSLFDPPVGTYIDEFYNARQNGNNFAFFDVERVEVLRGPQGTLYGRNTTGGSINVYMKKPAEKFGGFAEIGYGKYHQTTARATVDVPVIADKLLTKWSAYYIHDDGYVYNVTTKEHQNYQHTLGLRGAVEVRFSDMAKWDFSADSMKENYANLINFPNPNGSGRVSYSPRTKTRGLGPQFLNANGRLVNTGLFDHTWTREAISNFDIQLNDDTHFNVISGYHWMHFNNMTDGADGLNSASPNVLLGILVNPVPGNSTPLPNDNLVNQFTQELKVNGKAFGGKLEYVAGFYYFYEKADTDFANLVIPPSNLPAVSTLAADRLMLNSTDAYAMYSQGDVHITDQLKATAGVRYTIESKKVEFFPQPTPITRQFAPFTTADVVANGFPVAQQVKVWTPRFALNYQFNPDLLGYASATRGFKSGGWNGRSNLAQQVTPFGPEYNWTYEAGIKSDWLENRLRVNVNVFYSHTTDFQGASATVDRVTNLNTFLTANFGTMNNYGLEGQVTIVPIENLDVNWSFGYQNAKYANLNPGTAAQLALCASTQATTKTQCNAGVVTPQGTVGIPVRTPHFNQTLTVSYVFPLSAGMELAPTAGWNYTSNNWVSSSNQPGSFQPAHSLFNGGLTLRNRDQRWSVTAECFNCFNKTYVVSFLTFQYLNEPGRWSLRAKYDF